METMTYKLTKISKVFFRTHLSLIVRTMQLLHLFIIKLVRIKVYWNFFDKTHTHIKLLLKFTFIIVDYYYIECVKRFKLIQRFKWPNLVFLTPFKKKNGWSSQNSNSRTLSYTMNVLLFKKLYAIFMLFCP